MQRLDNSGITQGWCAMQLGAQEEVKPSTEHPHGQPILDGAALMALGCSLVGVWMGSTSHQVSWWFFKHSVRHRARVETKKLDMPQ
jgi:hypothetical protein